MSEVNNYSVLVCTKCKIVHFLKSDFYCGSADPSRKLPDTDWTRISAEYDLQNSNRFKWGSHLPGKFSETERRIYDRLSIIMFKHMHNGHRGVKLLRYLDKIPDLYMVGKEFTPEQIDKFRNDNPIAMPHYESGDIIEEKGTKAAGS